jgi:predicted HTH domain antitoxin
LKIETHWYPKLVILEKRNLDMALQTINIELPSDILLTLNESESELKKRIKLSLAIQLYIQQKITIGKAAQIADVTRFQFETLLSEYKIPISNLDVEDILGDIEKLK